MADRSFLTWPFFEDRHRELADALDIWAGKALVSVDHSDTDAACRSLVAMSGGGGLMPSLWTGMSIWRPRTSNCVTAAGR